MPLDPLDIILSSSLIGTILTLLMKWRHDRKKAPLEREQLLSTASTQNVTDALAISAEWKDALKLTREQMREDAEEAEARYQRKLTKLQERLTTLEDSNLELINKVTRLENDDRLNMGRITKLESNLMAAKNTVVKLVQYIRDHTPPNDQTPDVDYTIFEI